MKVTGWMAVFAALSLAVPVSAQDAPLTDGQKNLFAEMLALEDACDDLVDYNVAQDNLMDWITERLAQESDEDLEAVLTLRDEKLDLLLERAESIRAMPRGFDRSDAANEHMSNVATRCQRLADHTVGRRFFTRVPG